MCSQAEKNRHAPLEKQSATVSVIRRRASLVRPAGAGALIDPRGSGMAGAERRGGPSWLSQSGGNARRTAAPPAKPKHMREGE
jgi:hypothetical protein